MKDFHGFICQPTDTVKKGRKSKHCTSKNDSCKCFAEPVNLHYCDCPFVRKSCPIHGKPRHHCVKGEEENVIISFHPTAKTDKFFKPVKSLLAHCDPDTKISLEYYSPNYSKDGIKHRQVQTNLEDFNKSSGISIFAEKSRSFVAEKANKIKKLKECFKSPCDSIVTKAKSQTSLREKLNEHLRGYVKSGTNTLEDVLGDAYYERFKWTSSNKLDSSDWEKSSSDKMESDFLTVTKQKENNIIHHKIFEIKHKNNSYDFRFANPPKQSPFAYPSRIAKRFAVHEKMINPFNVSPQFQSPPQPHDYPSSPQSINPLKTVQQYEKDKLPSRQLSPKEANSVSGKSNSSSSGSAYFSPFILIPTGMRNMPKEEKPDSDAGVQVEGASSKLIEKSSQTDGPYRHEPESVISLLTQDKAMGSGILSPHIEVIYSHSDTPSPVKSKNSTPKRRSISDEIKPLEVVPENAHRLTVDRSTSTIPEETHQELFDEENKQVAVYVKNEASPRKTSKLVDDDENIIFNNKKTQTHQVEMLDKQTETTKAKKNKLLMTTPPLAKSVQTSLSYSGSGSQSNEGEFLDLDSNVTFVVPSQKSTNSSHEVDPSSWLKCRSDGELYCKNYKDPTGDGIMPLHRISLFNSVSSNSEIDSQPFAKIDQPRQKDIDGGSTNPLNENEQKPTQANKTSMSKGEQTSLSDLSELVKMVDHIFDKMSKTCECEKVKEQMFVGTTALMKPDFQSIEKEVQTSFRVVLDLSENDNLDGNPSKVKIGRSVLQNDDVRTIFLCNKCCQEINIRVVENSTITDIMATTPLKEKEVANVETSTDSLEKTLPVDKKIVNVTVCQSEPTEISPKADPPQASEPIVKDWALKITPVQCPVYVNRYPSNESKTVANKPYERKEPTVEKKNIKKENVPNAQDVYKPPSVIKPKPQTSKTFRSHIPSPVKENTRMKDREPILKTDSPPHRNPKVPKPQINQCPIQPRECICEELESRNKPPKPPKRPSNCPEGTSTQNMLQKPQTSTQPNGSTAKPAGTTRPTRTRKVPSHQSKIFFPVLIKPLWYENFSKTLQVIKDCDFGFKQKRSSQVGKDSPGGKKVKEKEYGSGECFGFEESFLPWSEKEPIDIRTETGLVWIPSSALQIPKVEGTHAASFAKVTKSETKVLKCSNIFKGSNKEATPAKRCRLKPVQVSEKHPFRKLFDFRVSKSLTFLKNEQKENFQKETSNDVSEHEAAETNDCYSPELSNCDYPSRASDEYAAESFFDSDRSDFCEGTENYDLEEKEECDGDYDDDDDDYERVEGCSV